MIDTIYIAVKDTIFSQQQIIDAYRDLVQSQQGTYTIFIIILLAILGANIAINYYFSTRRLRTEVKDVFREEKNNFRKDLESYIDNSIEEHTKKTEKQFIIMKAETFRLFAFNCIKNEYYAQAFNYLVQAVLLYEEIESGKMARICGEKALKVLDNFVDDEKNLWEEYFSDHPNRESLINLLKGFPDYLSQERKEILKLIPKENNDNNNKTETWPEENSQ